MSESWKPIESAPVDGTVIILSDGVHFAAGVRAYRVEPEMRYRGYNDDGTIDPDKFLEPVPNPDAGKRREWWNLFGCSAFNGDADVADYDGPLYFKPRFWRSLFEEPIIL